MSALAGGERVPLLAPPGPVLAARPGARAAASERSSAASPPSARAASTACPPPTARCCSARPRTIASDPADRAVDRGHASSTSSTAAERLVPAVRRELRDQDLRRQPARRPTPTYRLEADRRRPNLIHAAGIRSTGVSRLAGHRRARARPARRAPARRCSTSAPRRAGTRSSRCRGCCDHPDPEQLFAADPRYGQVVCACEQVTAAEIAAAFAMALPPRSLDALRKRTRATGGRCQGAVCMAGVSFLCSLHGGPAAVAAGPVRAGGDDRRGAGRCLTPLPSSAPGSPGCACADARSRRGSARWWSTASRWPAACTAGTTTRRRAAARAAEAAGRDAAPRRDRHPLGRRASCW